MAEKQRVDRNALRQVLTPEQDADVVATEDDRLIARLSSGEEYALVSTRAGLRDGERALHAPRAALADPRRLASDDLKWVGDLSPTSPDAVVASHADAFTLAPDRPAVGQRGLRTPQLGAVHSVLGSWTTGSTQPGTVVMPTGTGKTETMVALLSVAAAERLVVVVPSDALRGQVSRKFETLGVLQAFGVIASSALRPVVDQVQHAFLSAASAIGFARQCNVLVTTPNALFASDPAVTAALMDCCSHLFVDEAHHVEAPTWKRIRDAFADKLVLQFTATPFREDGRRLGGRIVYEFPLREAQRQAYFSEIDYTSVLDFENPDAAIAQKAVARVRQDLDAGFDHLLMARVRRIGRAKDVRDVYAQIAGDLEPVILHSTLPVGDQRAALDAIRERRSRIIGCVNMLGEGFDLPSLKVAAIHDPHRSLGVTLQFVGRFARVAGSDIGRASVFVGRPQPGYDESLRKLFAENADWNQIIRDLSESQISEQRDLDDFEAAFGPTADEVSIRSLAPKMSTVVYRTTCRDWRRRRCSPCIPKSNC